MGVPHGARQQHSTSAPAAGPFSRDFNESFMFSRPLAPPAPRARAFPRRSPRPAAGGEVLPPAPRAALSPAAPRARRRGEVFPRPLPAPRFSPPLPAPAAGEKFFPARSPRRAFPPAAAPRAAARAAARAAGENELASAASVWYNGGTVHGRDAGRQWGEHLRQHGGTRRRRLRRRGDARCAPRHSAAAARLPARNRAGVCDRKNQRGKPTCAL